jgi:hypothetical protein
MFPKVQMQCDTAMYHRGLCVSYSSTIGGPTFIHGAIADKFNPLSSAPWPAFPGAGGGAGHEQGQAGVAAFC